MDSFVGNLQKKIRFTVLMFSDAFSLKMGCFLMSNCWEHCPQHRLLLHHASHMTHVFNYDTHQLVYLPLLLLLYHFKIQKSIGNGNQTPKCMVICQF